MFDLTAKIFLFPSLLFVVTKLLPDFHFASLTQLLITGLVLAVLAAAADHLLLNKIKNPLSTLLDWGLTVILLWVSNWVWPGIEISLLSALLFATALAAVEYLTHGLLLRHHLW